MLSAIGFLLLDLGQAGTPLANGDKHLHKLAANHTSLSGIYYHPKE
jgi:hypothetical protein